MSNISLSEIFYQQMKFKRKQNVFYDFINNIKVSYNIFKIPAKDLLKHPNNF